MSVIASPVRGEAIPKFVKDCFGGTAPPRNDECFYRFKVRYSQISGATGLLVTFPNPFLNSYFQFRAKLTSALTPNPVAPRMTCGGCVCGYSDVVPTLSSTIPAMSQCAQG
jgi:hypothetical protein